MAVPAASVFAAPQVARADDGLVATQANALRTADDGSGAALTTPDGAAATDGAVDSEIEEEPEVVYSGVTISTRGKVQGAGWSDWHPTGTTGNTRGAGLVSLAVKLDELVGITGSVTYRVYKRGAGWQDAAADGAATKTVRDVEAVKIKLSGDVATHYDVLYRAYMSGRGWSKWARNGAKAGTTGKLSRVNAVQVKLSPRTVEAAGGSTATTSIRFTAYSRKTGWQAWVKNGKKVGTTGKGRALGGIVIEADPGELTGSITYRAHSAVTGWGAWKKSGKFAGSTKRNLEAVSIKLTGKLKKSYALYYRAYVKNYGWLDWATSGVTAGSTGYGLAIEALQVKLVAIDAAAPGETSFPTVNKLERSGRLNGIDISSWQSDINLAVVPADFVIAKATQGNWYTNPFFTKQADATLATGKLLGVYHFADLRGSAKQQADYFVKTIKPYLGRCVIVLDWEADALTLGPTWAKKFMDRVRSKTGVKPLIYLSQSVTKGYDWSKVAAAYQLWVAQYLYRNMNTGYLSAPEGGTDLGYWQAPIMYQYSSSGQLSGFGRALDLNIFYGSATVWRKLCK